MPNNRESRAESAGRARKIPWIAGAAAVFFALAGAAPAYANGPCSRQSLALKRACMGEVQNDFYVAKANCINILDSTARADCRDSAASDREDGAGDCRDQLSARLDLCDALGQARFNPTFDPNDFETTFDNQNPFFPLKAGNMWTYESSTETNTVEVLNKTKLIEGVTCIVVHDQVLVNGVPTEDTQDWYGQAVNGDVWYTGEESGEYETFPGDNPVEPELIDIEGSWKTGRDGGLPGVEMFANPVPGTTYRQELAFSEAEDAATIITDSYGYGSDPNLDTFVPQALAEALCGNNDCLVTREFTPLEPDANERKYYAPGIGIFLEVDLVSGDVNQLVGCNVDPACASLPVN